MLDALRSAAHPTFAGVLCSSACAPVVAAAVGAGAVPVALLSAVGGIGGGSLTNVISGVLDRLKREPPYRGLLPCREEHAPLFYGREVAVADLVERAAASLDLD
ncbi:hypothetical protein GCM10029992_26220 [Glycomyces albus]